MGFFNWRVVGAGTSALVVGLLFVMASHHLSRAAFAGGSAVSTRLQISPILSENLPQLYQTPLIPLDLTVGVQEKQDRTRTLQQVAQEQSKKYGSIAFVVRRPG